MNKIAMITAVALVATACVKPPMMKKEVDRSVPDQYGMNVDSVNSADVSWKEFFPDPYLHALIDSALKNNQELNITLQELEILRNEASARKGEYLPFMALQTGGGVDKVGRFTRDGALEATTEIEPGRAFPEPFSDSYIAATAGWEIDIWKKLRNARQASVMRYLSSIEGRKFMVTQLVAEIASSYYELLALDNELAIIERNIQIQSDALEIIRIQKQSARVTELAVQRFEAQLLKTQSLQFDVRQQIIETENRINFLVGRFPQTIQREPSNFIELEPRRVHTGLPTDLLDHRPDLAQAEQALVAAKLDVKVTKANFYPSLGLTAGVGVQAFQPGLLLSPESILYSLAGDLVAPVINRKAIKAMYYNANAKQIQAVYEYEQALLTAYLEVVNALSKTQLLEQSFALRKQQVEALNKSIEISNNLFRSARADYMEVLMTQREALESRFELVETRKEQFGAMIKVYQALGGGWN